MTLIAHRLLVRTLIALDLTAKEKTPVGGKSEVKPAAADHAAKESEARGKDLKKALAEVNDLSKKLEGKGGAKVQKQFDVAYADIHDLGEKAAAAGEKLVKEYRSAIGKGFRGEEKAQREGAITMLSNALRQWSSSEVDHFRPKDTRGKVLQAEQTFGFAAEVETWVRQISKTLKGEHHVDSTWMN
jgi:hypothetical protein